MRVRLYEVGSTSVGVVVIDKFPTGLMLSENGELMSQSGEKEVCRLEENGGHILFRACDEECELTVNDAPLEEGPLMPGDRLRFRNRNFLVSYECTVREPPPSKRYRIQM